MTENGTKITGKGNFGIKEQTHLLEDYLGREVSARFNGQTVYGY